jgi:hypothetical protein
VGVERIPFLRRNIIPGSLLYGFGVFIVMNLIVTPLSAAPTVPAPTTPELILIILDHLLFYGLLLGILVKRNINTH